MSDGVLRVSMTNFLSWKTIKLKYNAHNNAELTRANGICNRARVAGSGVTVEETGRSPNKILTLSGNKDAINAVLTVVHRSPSPSPPKSPKRTTQKKLGGIAFGPRRTTHRPRTRSRSRSRSTFF